MNAQEWLETHEYNEAVHPERGTELQSCAAAIIRSLLAENEQLRVQLAGCGVAAMQNTPESIKERAKEGDYGYSESYADVCRAVDREMELRARCEAARQEAFRECAEIAEKIHCESMGRLNKMAPSQQIVAAIRERGKV